MRPPPGIKALQGSLVSEPLHHGEGDVVFEVTGAVLENDAYEVPEEVATIATCRARRLNGGLKPGAAELFSAARSRFDRAVGEEEHGVAALETELAELRELCPKPERDHVGDC